MRSELKGGYVLMLPSLAITLSGGFAWFLGVLSFFLFKLVSETWERLSETQNPKGFTQLSHQ